MTYLSVIAAAGAAALIASSAQADVSVGVATGKRVHKPMAAADRTDLAADPSQPRPMKPAAA